VGSHIIGIPFTNVSIDVMPFAYVIGHGILGFATLTFTVVIIVRNPGIAASTQNFLFVKQDNKEEVRMVLSITNT
jgi:hypothetical protein